MSMVVCKTHVLPTVTEPDESRVGLIIGDTTDSSTRIWVRGDARLRFVRIALLAAARRSVDIALSSTEDYTDVATFTGLDASTPYDVVARFAPSRAALDTDALERRGSLRTFPRLGEPTAFSFLLGSCNLSTTRLSSLYAFVVGLLGASAVRRSLNRPVDTWYWPPVVWARYPLRWLGRWLAGGLVGGVQWATRFELPAAGNLVDLGTGNDGLAPAGPGGGLDPGLKAQSPFQALRAQLTRHEGTPAFMIHAGDQIYFDLDIPQRQPVAEEYRRSYRQTWLEDPDARDFLATCPQYMILDDHEIADSFENPEGGSDELLKQRDAALRAYRQYVQTRQPASRTPGALYYEFQYGSAFFFVLDTRTERHRGQKRMISEVQRDVFLAWLRAHAKDLAFVVSSVPFVAQVKAPGPRPAGADDDKDGERRDKWSADEFRAQRDEIIEAILDAGMRQLVFLTGDMHCGYHATMRIGPPAERVVIHELAGGPINQVEFGQRRDFFDHYRGVTGRDVQFASLLRSFQSGTGSVTRIDVRPGASPRLRWEIVSTSPRVGDADTPEPGPLGGRIGFGVNNG